MLQPVRRRIFGWITFSLFLGLLFGAPGICGSQAFAAAVGVNDPSPRNVESVATDVLLFGVLVVAVASAAIAVRMVRRWH